MPDRAPPTVGVWSETAPLRACITFTPGDEFDHMVPGHIEAQVPDASGRFHGNPDYLLFDDLVLLPLLQAEHAEMISVIRAVTGPRGSLDLRDMLRHVLAAPEVAGEVVDQVLELERQADPGDRRLDEVRRRLLDLAPGDLTHALLSGADPDTDEELLRWPMPNWLFARDCWAVVGDAVVVGWPRPRARKRDGVLSRALLHHHPLLRDVPRLDVREGDGLAPDEDADPRTVEGGDVLVVSPDLVLIGIGVRTTETAARSLAGMLRARGVRHVLGVYLPGRRATMHLDTVFTFVDQNAVLVHEPTFAPHDHEQVRVVDLAEPERLLGHDLVAVLGELGIELEVVACGDGDPRAAAREQWTDGANAFCLGPGRVLLYARNTRTVRALNRAGFEVMTPERFVDNADLLMTGERRLVVALTGAELSRGRGGPRCLTLPVSRLPVAGR